jgi:hypothetical protein
MDQHSTSSNSEASPPAEIEGNAVEDDNNDRNVSSGSASDQEARSAQEDTPSPLPAVGNDDETVDLHVDIIATLERQCAAWNAGDINGYMNGYADDAIYVSQSVLKTRTTPRGNDKKDNNLSGDICLHGRAAIATLFADVLERSRSNKQFGRLSYRQLQIQYATTDRAFVLGRYEYTTSQDHKVIDAGVFTLDMARVFVTSAAGGRDDDHDDNETTREWKIKTEHASSSFLKRR